MTTRIRFAASIFIGSLFLASCSLSAPKDSSDSEYDVVILAESKAGRPFQRPSHKLLTPPKQLAAWVHPHRDTDRGIWVDGYWIYILLGDGWRFTQVESWEEREIVPDAEASSKEIQKAMLLDAGRSVSVPYRTTEDR